MSFGSADCRYLTGFTGEPVGAVLTAGESMLISDARFTIQAAEESPETRFVLAGDGRDELIVEVLGDMVRERGGGTIVVGFDPDHLTVKRWERLRELLENTESIQHRFATGLVERCRRVKFQDELEAMRSAGRLAAEAFAYLETIPVVGRSERDVSLDLEVFLRRGGSEGVAFPFIVAAGERGAMPHADASAAIIAPDRLLVLDIGAVVDGYASDITRTYATGPVSPRLAQAYEVVREAQALAVEAVKNGITARQLDGIARGHLEAAGLGDYFVHSVGHGVGLEVHEGPGLGSRSDDTLETGMVVTVEPGVYFTGEAGIRIEDTVVVGSDGPEILTECPRDLRFLR